MSSGDSQDTSKGLTEALNDILTLSDNIKKAVNDEVHTIIPSRMQSSKVVQGYMEEIAVKIMRQEIKEESDSKNYSVSTVKDVIVYKANETRLKNDLAFFSLNNASEFIRLCRDTLSNSYNPKTFSDEFNTHLNKLYYLSENFTNAILAFYMENREKLEFVDETSYHTENFRGSTNLYTIRQSKVVNLHGGSLVGDTNKGYLVFSVDFTDSLNIILSFMFEKSSENNPFKITMGELDYYRDLRNEFTTYTNFEMVLLNQLTENILNQTNSMLVGLNKNKGYFVGKYRHIKEFKNRFDFKVYGVPFSQKAILEKLEEY